MAFPIGRSDRGACCWPAACITYRYTKHLGWILKPRLARGTNPCAFAKPALISSPKLAAFRAMDESAVPPGS